MAEADPSAVLISLRSGILADNVIKQELRSLQKSYPFLAQPTHDFYERLVKVCEEALLQGNDDIAADLLERIKVEVKQEERTLKAAFFLFTPPGTHKLTASEIHTMLEYLGFPAASSDVASLLKAVDANGDGDMSFEEFQMYVGRMGGSHKLFAMRRANIAKKYGTADAGGEGDMELLAEDLKAAGIMEQEQAYWSLVLPRAQFEFGEAARLMEPQRNAVRQIRTLAKGNHEKALPTLQKKVLSLNYTENDLWMTLAYIRELAPIIVHVNLDKSMEFMEKDTHYRNQFETNTSGGLLKPTVREQWEKDLFASAYDGAEGFARPKYGVLNAMNDYRGVVKCCQYGDSYIVLKDVRLRCTFSPEDSANLKADRLAVLDYYAHVLHEYSTEELQETIKIAKSSEAAILGDSSKVGKMKYKETQVHGEIQWGRHVERLVAHQRHRDKEQGRLEALCSKHGWTLSWMDQEQERMLHEESSKLGEEAWKEKLKAIMEKVPDVKGVPKGFCRKGCGRPVQPGKTGGGNDFTTCCRGCALGFGHNLTCGSIDPDSVKPGMCLNGCGRPVNPGRMTNGKIFTTCCRGCAHGKHDGSCGQDVDEVMCKFRCGRKACPSSGGRRFDTCCRGCATSKAEPRSHDPACIE